MDRVAAAVHETVVNSSKPAKAIAADMGMGYQVLLNKANEMSTCDSFNWAQIQLLIHHSKNPLIGQELQRLAETPGTVTDMLTAVLTAGTEQGRLRAVLLDVNSDGKITPIESKQVMSRLNELRKALDGIEATVVALANPQCSVDPEGAPNE